MSAVAVAQFITTIELHFPRRKFNGDETMEAAWMASMTKALGRFPDDILADAAVRILRTRHPKRDGALFPSPAECEEFCEQALEAKRLRETPLLEAPREATYEDRVRLARELMRSPMGQAAIRDGWGETMFHFCVEHRRVPAAKELDECRISARQFSAEYERLLRGDHPFRGPLAKLAENMMRKARELMGEKAA